MKSKGGKRMERRKEVARDYTQIKKDVAQGVRRKPGETNLPEDLPGRGKFYCAPCSRYFLNSTCLMEHTRSKPHRRRVKTVEKHTAYDQADAEMAAGLGTDNGPRLRPPREPAAAVETPLV
eukprot:CAMPEP_0175914036 /NCGR_PEP_ID=MMETSP0108-20121206/9583_1 /TAXON_ID=195067 ORGANISM="Goniomonas pacifica, Strain CCMP1869" /NCGR_SAMPLE_ID=MMETSP0108 /ASSEMBLY_ACC=CAM_ASM_000204 /LENGTH=120 /DNA_ID=CAMNT_0017236463 /DNA_START=12 /DNA_END=374 /DNA_ORIENTATION=+